ncbi:hypothetical protein ACHAW6_009279 [Cyclotella cf. meneghiniana]
MKEGLDKRQRKNSSVMSSVTDANNSQISSSILAVEAFPSARIPFDETIADKRKRSPGRQRADDEESQIDLPIRHCTAGATPVTDVIRDITRRSTRFADEGLFKKISKTDRAHTSSVETTKSELIEASSDTEIERSKERPKSYTLPKSTDRKEIELANHKDKSIPTEGDLQGHFTLGSFDITKVRPVILNSQIESRDQDGEDARSLNERISHQGNMIEQLSLKIGQLENRSKAALRKSPADETPRAVHHVLRDQHLVTSRHAPFNEDEEDFAHQINCDQEVSGYAVVENDKMCFLPRCAGVVICRYQDSGHKANTSSMP